MAGFTLIELMIVLVIAAVLITIGVPSFNEFIAGQRIRTAVSNAVADAAFARAEAIKESRPAIMERLTGATNTWKDGWRICVDLNRNGVCNAGEERKLTQPISGRLKVCANASDFDTRIVFRPDGRVVRASAPGTNDGLVFSDDMADGNAATDRIRTIVFGISGRPLVINQDGGANGGVLCP